MCDGLVYTLANLHLIAIDSSTVDEAVSCFDGVIYDFLCLLFGYLPSPESEQRQLVSTVEYLNEPLLFPFFIIHKTHKYFSKLIRTLIG